MKPLEAWHIINGCMNELASIRSSICGNGYSLEEVDALVICFEALRRMEEGNENRAAERSKRRTGGRNMAGR